MSKDIRKLNKEIRDLRIKLAEAEFKRDELRIGGEPSFRVHRKKTEKVSSKKTNTKRSEKRSKNLARDARVLELLQEGSMTQTQIAKEVGIHQAQVSQIKKKAGLPMMSRKDIVKKMREAASKKTPKPTKKETKPAKKTKALKKDTRTLTSKVAEVIVEELSKDRKVSYAKVRRAISKKHFDSSVRATFNKVANIAISDGAAWRVSTRPMVIRSRNKKKVRSLRKL